MKKLLLIEDDRDFSDLMQVVLKQAGYQTQAGFTGKEGLALMKGSKPDLIIVDIMLPDMSGAEVVMSIKADPAYKGIPVMFLTGLISAEDGREGSQSINVGEKHYPALAKPFNIPVLLNMVKRILEK